MNLSSRFSRVDALKKIAQDNSDNSVVYMGEEAQKQYEGQPWVRYGLGAGTGLGTYGAYRMAKSELGNARKMPKMVDPDPLTRAEGSFELQEATEALKAKRKANDKYVKDHPVESRNALVDTTVENRWKKALKKTYGQVPNAERIAAMNRFKRWGKGAGLGALLTLLDGWSILDHYNMADKIEKGRNGEY